MPSANDIQHGGSHYKNATGVQHWDLITDYAVGYLEGCATKYVYRWRLKNGLEDLQKAEHFCQKLIEKFEVGEFRGGGKVPIDIAFKFCRDNNVGMKETDFIVLMLTWQDQETLKKALEVVREIITDYRAECAATLAG